MEALRGRSGVLHSFTRVAKSPRGASVADVCEAEACELDVIRLYVKAFDVEAVSAQLIAPSCTPRARELAQEYGIELRSPTTRSHRT